MAEKEYLSINNIIQIKQPIGRFLVGTVKANDLLKITHQNPRKYNEELDNYAGIQREIINEKIKQLKSYINTSDAAFPNTIIGTLNPNKFIFDEDKNVLKIEIDRKSFAIIDGQHRLASFKNEGKLAKEFDIIVTFFLGLDLEEQAYLFSIINMTQKNLNPSLVQDLTELFTIITPEKLVHNFAKIFNNERSSPLYKKIKMLGKDVGPFKGTLSQYTFTKGIINLIVDKRKYYEIRDILKTCEDNRSELKVIKMDSRKYIFWDLYINERDNLLYEILQAYFKAMKKVYSTEWGNKEFILTKTTGYNAFMRLLRDLYKIAMVKNIETKQDFYERYLGEIKNNIKPLTSDNYPPGSKGENQLYNEIIDVVKQL